MTLELTTGAELLVRCITGCQVLVTVTMNAIDRSGFMPARIQLEDFVSRAPTILKDFPQSARSIPVVSEMTLANTTNPFFEVATR
jgi:hypothetical protein